MKTLVIAATLLLSSLVLVHAADADDAPACPAAVSAAMTHAFPKATINACKAEREDGHDQFEVRLTLADGTALEVDVTPAGVVLQTEQVVPVNQVPALVAKAFAAKYPAAKATRAEKQTRGAKGDVFFELAFQVAGKKLEATFASDGRFIEEE